MTRLIALAIALLSIFAASASARSAANDPRVCATYHSARLCGGYAAQIDLRHALQIRFGGVGLYGGAIACRSTGSAYTRWICTFHDGLVTQGKAIILLGAKPTWKPTVTVVTIVCNQPYQGCP